MKKEKSRFFTFLIYPDSVPENWKDLLETLGLPIAISPIHDKDKSEVEGQKYKKAHYHVIYIAKNPVTAESVRIKIKRLLGDNSVAMVQIVKTSIENLYLYLTHESKDALTKNKYVYDKKDITLLNNFDIDRYIVLDVEEKNRIADILLGLVIEYKICNMADLVDLVKVEGQNYGISSVKVMNECLIGKTGLLKLYFDGYYQNAKRNISAE